MRHEVAHALEPEPRELRQHLALVGDAGAEHVVERGDAIGGDDEQLIADLVDVAHLAAAMERQAVREVSSRGALVESTVASRKAEAYQISESARLEF